MQEAIDVYGLPNEATALEAYSPSAYLVTGFEELLWDDYSDEFASYSSADCYFESNTPAPTPPPTPTPEPTPEPEYYAPVSNAMNDILDALRLGIEIGSGSFDDFGYKEGTEPGTVTITYDVGDALPLGIMRTLADNPMLSLEYTFFWKGEYHTVLISGEAMAELVDDSIPWYGAEWLLKFIGEGASANQNRGLFNYVVQADDYLSRIADQYGVTVEDILAVNPQISNPNLIHVNDVILIPGRKRS